MKLATRSLRQTRTQPVSAALGVALLAPVAALAEPFLQVPLYGNADMTRYSTNNVEVGIGYNSEDSFKYGEWTGLYQQGAFAIGNFNLKKGFGNDDRNAITAFGWNLGLPSRQLGLEVGRQGQYSIGAGFDQITRYQYGDMSFVNQGLGTNFLPGPGVAVTAANKSGLLRQFDIEQQRNIFTLDGTYTFGGGWEARIDDRHDVTGSDSTKLFGANFGFGSQWLLPYQQDETIDTIEAIVRYTSPKWQLQASYIWSGYRNDSSSVTWQNPTTVNAFPGAGWGRIALAPSNDFNQINVTGAYNFEKNTRVNATFSYGLMTQNEAFLPAAVNPAIAAPLPQSSLDGKIATTLFDVSLFSRPMSKLTLRAGYKFYDVDNKTSSTVYQYNTTDGAISGNQPRNVPYSTRENRFKLDADYRIFDRTNLRGFYVYENTQYNPLGSEARTKTYDNLLGVELRRSMSETFTGSIKYSYETRNGSVNNVSPPYLYKYPFGTAPTNRPAGIPPYDQAPTLRQFHLSDYDKNAVQARGDIGITSALNLNLLYQWSDIKHKGPDCGGATDQSLAPGIPSNCLGRTRATGQDFTADLQWTAASDLTAYTFYTYSYYKNEQSGRNWAGNYNNLTNTALDWGADLKYTDNTFGIGMRWAPREKKYDLGAQYLYTIGTGMTGVSAASGAAASGGVAGAVPDTKDKVQSLQLFGKYQYSKNVLFRLNYRYDRMTSNDWSWDDIPLSSTLYTGHQSPDYSAHVIAFSVAYTNW